jgi:hypothetical protein
VVRPSFNMSMRNVGPIDAASIVLTPSLTLGLSPLNFSPDPIAAGRSGCLAA